MKPQASLARGSKAQLETKQNKCDEMQLRGMIETSPEEGQAKHDSTWTEQLREMANGSGMRCSIHNAR
jgi:hypothetical protein